MNVFGLSDVATSATSRLGLKAVIRRKNHELPVRAESDCAPIQRKFLLPPLLRLIAAGLLTAQVGRKLTYSECLLLAHCCRRCCSGGLRNVLPRLVNVRENRRLRFLNSTPVITVNCDSQHPGTLAVPGAAVLRRDEATPLNVVEHILKLRRLDVFGRIVVAHQRLEMCLATGDLRSFLITQIVGE